MSLEIKIVVVREDIKFYCFIFNYKGRHVYLSSIFLEFNKEL